LGATVAIMQPYFIPYAGYFRLLAQSDLFVIYDCVQFPRRGWVHRNKLIDRSGEKRWLTIPLAKGPQSLLIKDLRFPGDAATEFVGRLRLFPLDPELSDTRAEMLEALRALKGTPLDYIERLLRLVSAYLGLPWCVMRSSELQLPGSLHGQDRIIEIARRVGATRYINAPGGRDLYDAVAFAKAGIELNFLPPYEGIQVSILARILSEDRCELLREMRHSR
jgi:hypothetical protein